MNLIIDPENLLVIVIPSIQQPLDPLLQHRMNERWIYITDGLQDKAPFMHAGMRDFKPWGLHHLRAVEDDIQVE
jgi:hypothetical protein